MNPRPGSLKRRRGSTKKTRGKTEQETERQGRVLASPACGQSPQSQMGTPPPVSGLPFPGNLPWARITLHCGGASRPFQNRLTPCLFRGLPSTTPPRLHSRTQSARECGFFPPVPEAPRSCQDSELGTPELGGSSLTSRFGAAAPPGQGASARYISLKRLKRSTGPLARL